jgi:methionine synthase II (cobalamin-independent)
VASSFFSSIEEPLARRIFGGIDAQRLMLEYDDERSGDFGPLTRVPEDKVAILGLVTTKTPGSRRKKYSRHGCARRLGSYPWSGSP